MIPLYGLGYDELVRTLSEAGLEPLRVTQTVHGLYRSRADTFRTISTLPKDAKRLLEERFRMFTLAEKDRRSSDDGCTKVLWEAPDGALFESVLLPNTKDGHTACLSTQAGCPLACAFCATGQTGFRRDLGPHEMVEQAVRLGRIPKTRLTNIVFMGMGEPFLNTDNLFTAIRILNDPRLFGIGARQITVSTVGIPEGIRRLADLGLQVRLAVSLHWFRQETRERWIPAARAHTLDAVVSALRDYQKASRRQFTVEWTLFRGLNDRLGDADDLLRLLRGLNYSVNLILWNPVEDCPPVFKPASPEAAVRIRNHLRRRGIPATVRRSRGASISAACGQLRAVHHNPPKA